MGSSRLAQQQTRQADVGSGRYRRSRLDELTAAQIPRPTLLSIAKGRTISMNDSNDLTRRALFAKVALLLNGLAATPPAVPVLLFLLSPALSERQSASQSWVSLGGLD